MIQLITFSDENMTESARVCVESVKANGVDQAAIIQPAMIDYYFRKTNRSIFDQQRGVGYWLWKPYICYHTISEMKDGDILIYSDAGIKWISNVNEIISRMDQDIFLFSNGHQHVHWCKMDIMAAINGVRHGEIKATNERQYDWKGFVFPVGLLEHQQCQASVIFIKVNQNTRNFIKEWLLWCQMPGFIDDSPSKLPNHPEFAEHRHDQAILTCLQIKYGYKLHWWADKLWYESQRYRWSEDTYPSMWEHHRRRDRGKGGGVNPEW